MTELAAVVRFVHLAAAVLVAGSYTFVVFVSRDAGALALHRRLTRWSVAVVVATAIVALWLQSLAVIGEAGIGAMAGLLADTLYGNVWIARMVLAIALLLVPVSLYGGGLALALCLLASVGLSGHAAAGEGAELALQLGSDALHLVAAGAWIGGLVPFAVLLRSAPANVASHATRRFSLLGMVSVSALLVTGLINAGMLVGGWPQLLGTPYGRLLLVKLSLLLPLLGIAFVNLTRLNPAVAAGSRGAAQTLRRNALLEAGIGLIILLVVGFLGTTPPARHVAPEWPFDFRWDWTTLNRSPRANAELDRGLMWLSGALTAMTIAFFFARIRPWLLAAGLLIAVYAGYLVVAPVTTDAYPTTYRRPDVPYQAISIANGKALYGRHCAVCHGAAGYGDGPAAEGMTPRPADLTAPHANDHTAGDLFWWLSHGVKAMPAFGKVLTEEERWDLINFARTLSSGEKAKKALAPVVDDKAVIVAPDFAYTTGDGHTGALRDHRGERVVLLVLGDGAPAADPLLKRGIAVVVVSRRPPRSRSPAVVVEGNAEIHETYALLARSFDDETPRHVEFLIDRQGYIRARWLTPADPAAVLRQAELLAKEKPRAPAPDEHVH